MVPRGNLRPSEPAPPVSHRYSPSELEQLAAIVSRARRAGLDPTRVLTALAVPASVVSTVVQRADL